jgi:hypothetical protein
LQRILLYAWTSSRVYPVRISRNFYKVAVLKVGLAGFENKDGYAQSFVTSCDGANQTVHSFICKTGGESYLQEAR